jgi:hypothetical protein
MKKRNHWNLFLFNLNRFRRDQSSEAVDIEPIGNRLVVFKSDAVLHQVRATLPDLPLETHGF